VGYSAGGSGGVPSAPGVDDVVAVPVPAVLKRVVVRISGVGRIVVGQADVAEGGSNGGDWLIGGIVLECGGGEVPELTGGAGAVVIPGDDLPVIGGGVVEGAGVVGGTGPVCLYFWWWLGVAEVDIVGDSISRVRVAADPGEVDVDIDISGIVCGDGVAGGIGWLVRGKADVEDDGKENMGFVRVIGLDVDAGVVGVEGEAGGVNQHGYVGVLIDLDGSLGWVYGQPGSRIVDGESVEPAGGAVGVIS